MGIAYSIVGGSTWEPTPWGAVQRAAGPLPLSATAAGRPERT